MITISRSSIFSLPISVKSGESVSSTVQAVKLLRKLYNVDTETRQNLVLMVGSIFLARQIRIFEVLAWDRNSYLTHVILPRLSREDCTLVVLELACAWLPCEFIVMSK